jgi:radical SAM superfamily enzyme YgiQ (UPF0313 family)
MRVLLISTYDLGRQPFGLASPAAWLRRAGVEVECVDVAKDSLHDDAIRAAGIVAFYLPMHTATRLAVPVIARSRRVNPAATLCCYGLYASLNAPFLEALGVSAVLGAEFESDLVDLALSAGERPRPSITKSPDHQITKIPRLSFVVPDRTGLPPLDRYASLVTERGERRMVGYTEASRGCKHHCRHCPVVPVYQGRFRVVSSEVVLEDIRAQVVAGAQHITFGDPDFFNGVGHARTILEAFHREFPDHTYDVTIKIEHLLRHRDMLGLLRETGCAFVTSAAESIDDHVLSNLKKGHTRADFVRVVHLCRDAGLTLAPTFVAFTPWTDLADYRELVDVVADLGLVEHVAPIQLALRLLIPQGSGLLALPEIAALATRFDPVTLTYPWRHPDPEVDALQHAVMDLVGRNSGIPRRVVFDAIADLAYDAEGLATPRHRPVLVDRASVPFLTEPWYC